jgi:hypothetical protein
MVTQEDGEPLRLLLDADTSSHTLVRLLTERGHDVVAAGLVDELKQLDDPVLFAVAQEQRRIVVTHNVHDFPDILAPGRRPAAATTAAFSTSCRPTPTAR